MTENAAAPYKTMLTKVNDTMVSMTEAQFNDNHIEMSDYQKTVTLNAMTAMSRLLDNNGLSINQIDHNNISDILLTVAALQLNASAEPREVYFQLRNKNKGTQSSPNWVKEIEMGIEGDGNDALLSNFGRDVEQVYPFWAVRDGDSFSYPKHVGMEVTPPEWGETGKGKVLHVVYPIEHKDGSMHYYIGEREDVKRNLLAHISNNLMRDKDKFTKMATIKEKTADMTLDAILDDPELVKLGQISPAWREPQSRETMILRKIRNNITKKIPKDFGNGLAAMKYTEATDENYKAMRRDVTEQANTESFDAIAEQSAPQPTPVDSVAATQPVQPAQAAPEPAPVEESRPAPIEPEPSPEPQAGEADPF